MTESRPEPVRQIVFQNTDNNTFLWACSHCNWNTPYLMAGNSHAVDPVKIVSDFEAHDCEKFQSNDDKQK